MILLKEADPAPFAQYFEGAAYSCSSGGGSYKGHAIPVFSSIRAGYITIFTTIIAGGVTSVYGLGHLDHQIQNRQEPETLSIV